jgi:glycosyltransferase involved in cell wall biosynthesis
MRFVLFTTNLSGGGAEKALANIASGLVRRGHVVDFIVGEHTGIYSPPVGCHFHALSIRVGHGWLGKRRLAWALRRHLRNTTYDLFVSTLPFADEVASLARVPRHVCRIANTLSAEVACLPAGKSQRRQARYRALFGARTLVAVSQGVADDMQKQFGIVAKDIRVITNPFDLTSICTLANAPCPERPVQPYILHVGRFAKQKRHDLLLTAFAQLAPSHLLVLLTPSDAALTALIAKHGLERRVAIADFQVNPYPWMAGADLLVLCSDHEGLPNVLIEALACGTRVVSTDCPSGPREILVGRLAQGLVPCNDAEALTLAMQLALAQPLPDETTVAAALAPYSADRALNAWEFLSREDF